MAAEKQVLVRTFLVLSFVSVASISVIYFLSLSPADSNAAGAAAVPPESVCWNGLALFESHLAVRQSTPPQQHHQRQQQQQREEDEEEEEAISVPAHDSSSPASSPSGNDGVLRGRATGTLVQIVGVGCRSCYVGSTCSFDLTLSSGAYWQDSELTRRRELMVKIDGPSLLEGAALPVTSSVSGFEWSISYTPFDAGVYVVTVYSECAVTSLGERNNGSLFSDPVEKMHNESTNTIAEFRLTVYEEPSPQGRALRPCDGGFYGRWLPASLPNKDDYDDHLSKNNQNDHDDGDAHNDGNDVNDHEDDGTSGGSSNGHVASFRWQFFECAKQVDALEFLAAMASKGIREISFVGDSHNRRLYHHVCFLLTGHVNSSERVAQVDLSRHVSLIGQAQGGGSRRRFNLTLRFLFVPGIWDGSGAYGCPLDSFGRRKEPPHLPSTGLFVFNAAHWEYELCLEPEMAYARYLPIYLEWGRQLAKQEGARLVWRSTTPFNVRTWGCSWGIFPRQRNYTAWRTRRGNGQGAPYLPPLGRTNAGFRLANEFAKRAADVAGFQYYDSWQVEAPFYFDSSSKDCHYSQITSDGRMRGIVGEAVARDFMSWAATRMR